MKIAFLTMNTIDRVKLSCLVIFFSILPAMTSTTFADTSLNDNRKILQEKLSADKKLLVAENMGLTEIEAKNFWPIYDAYQKDLQQINDRLNRLISEYALVYNANAVTNEKARHLLDEAIEVEFAEIRLKQSYIPKIAEVLSGVKTVRYMQIENKIRSLARYEISEMIPLAVEGRTY